MEVEAEATRTLLDARPEDLRGADLPLLCAQTEDAECRRFVKAADKLSALIKCIEERRSGNMEFADAERGLWQAVKNMHMPEVDAFLAEFMDAFSKTLDEQTQE